MATRISLIVEAEDRASSVLKSISGKLGSIGSGLKAVAGAAIAYGVFDKIASGVMDAVNATVAYTDEVRNLALVSGQGTEEAGRMLQVMDDFGLTADDATTAVRTLTKQGLAPTIDTLAQLADEYNSLSTVQEKNAFVLKNLGRSGLQWATMLSKGGDSIRSMAASVSDVLAPTEAAVKAAEDYKFALDAWVDKTNELKQSIGMALIPTLTDLLDITTNLDEGAQQVADSEDAAKMSIWERAKATVQAAEAMGDEDAAARAAARAVGAMGDAEAGAVGPSKELTDALKEQSSVNQTILGNMFSIQSAAEDFARGEEERAARMREIEAEKMKLAGEQMGYWNAEEIINRKLNKAHADKASLYAQSAQNMGRLNELTKEQLSLDEEYNKLQAEGAQAIEDKNNATDRMVYNMLEQKAAADGLVSSDETRFLQETAVTMGLVDRASADAAIQAAQTADAFWEGFEKTGQAMTSTKTRMDLVKQSMDKIAEYDGRVINYTVAMNVISGVSSYGTSNVPYVPPEYGERRAGGGPVRAGMPYMVGEQGPEMFIPQQGGQIVPNNRLNQSVTININGTFRVPQDMDYVAQEVAKIMAR